VDLDRLLHPDRALGGELGWLGPLAPKACRRLACDSALTRVLVTRHPSDHDDPGDHHLGGAPSQPLDLGRTTRVVTPAQCTALAVRVGGGVVPDCQRPLAWCEAHHLISWLEGGPTDLANLALVCRAHHHRAVHEGDWRLARAPDGRWTRYPTPSTTLSPTTPRRRLTGVEERRPPAGRRSRAAGSSTRRGCGDERSGSF
jgi:hypothetical protein